MKSLRILFFLLLGLYWTPALSAQLGPLLLQPWILEKIKAQFPELETRLLSLSERADVSSSQSSRIRTLSENANVQDLIDSFQGLWKPSLPKDYLFQDVSPSCVTHTRSYLRGIQKTWALQMFDAMPKFPSGILSGHTQLPGDMKECIQIRGDYPSGKTEEEKKVQGRYCSTYLLPGPSFPNLSSFKDYSAKDGSNSTRVFEGADLMQSASLIEFLGHLFDVSNTVIVLPMIGTCFPASCSHEDIQQMYNNYHTNISSGFFNQLVVGCYTDEKPAFEAGEYVMIVLLAIFACLCGAASIIDVYITSVNRDLLGTKLLLAFSVYTNTKRFVSTRTGGDDLGCLHGLRVLSMAWVVLGHTFLMGLLQMTWNLFDVRRLHKDWSLYPLLNATVSVDTFFVMSGALVAYNLLRELDKNKGRFNYPLMVLHRYLRLTPTYVILIGIMATLLPYLGTGPLWVTVEAESLGCAKNWWHNILYVNNLITYTTESPSCYGEAWYLANDMQFFLLSPLVIYPLWRWKAVGLGLLAVLSVASVTVNAWIVEAKNLAPAQVVFTDTAETFDKVYIKPWTRFGPYVIGIFLGYILYLRKKNPSKFRNIHFIFVIAGWCLSTAGALGVIYGPMRYFDPANAETTYDSWHATMYAGLHRYVWGLVIAWIVFACVSGYGGIVNSFLSLKMFVPLGRLTFCMYITAYHVQEVYHMGITHPAEFSVYNFVYIYFAHLFVSGIVAYILTVTLESPFNKLEKIAFSSRASPAPREGNANGGSRSSKNGAVLETNAKTDLNV